ncbi:MAG: hypothetical protein M1833_004413, partial [Piccolia ochrophora]
AGRINWAQGIAQYIDPKHKREWSELWTPRGEGLILRSIRIDYKFPMKWPDRVSVYHKLRSAPSTEATSFALDVIILSELHQRPAARCSEDVVVYDYLKDRKTGLQPFMREILSRTFQQQERAKEQYSKQAQQLIHRTEQLELASWNRDGAEEDTGSPGT